MIKKERIVCSAIEITGVNDNYDGIHLGLRHSDCFQSLTKLRHLLNDPDEIRIKYLNNNTQGFLTSKNRFVDRIEGMKIAIENDQIIEKSKYKDELFSECLY